jgi:formamidopyrimidine-DNA glycosylase
MFAGETVYIDSPQGRFSSEAKKISRRRLERARAIGKQLFLEFDNDLTLRVHLGIYGKWRRHTPGDFPAVVGEVRARFSSSKAIFELRGPTVCEVLDDAEVKAIEHDIGQDCERNQASPNQGIVNCHG